MRWGWPERVGGLGGSPLLRGYLGEALTARDLIEPGLYSMTEVLVPTMIDFAPRRPGRRDGPPPAPGRRDLVPGVLGAGHRAATSARWPAGRRAADDGWRVTGQKVWTSLAQYAQRCVLLTRTGTPESAHRGITALFVDMDTPGITVRPIETLHGVAEFCEVFFDDVPVPGERLLGEVGGGLVGGHGPAALRAQHRAGPPRRPPAPPAGPARWPRSPDGALDAGRGGRRVPRSSTPSGPGPAPPSTGWPRATASGRRRRSTRSCWPPPSRRCSTWSATASPTTVVLGDDPAGERWRTEFLYSRAATIYGGSAEIQRNIIAKRLLDLGNDR